MIKLIKIHIEEIRGIKKLTLQPDGDNFVIHGPNGSGKSGVVDAIDFGLTGNISRLAGKGTGSLSLKIHGPHVDARDRPETSLVRLTLKFPKLGKTATIERKLSSPKKLIVSPDEPDIRAVLEQVEQHSELSLSRREIIKYVLSEGATRSKDVQALLKLDDLGQLRATFKTASNQLLRDQKNATESSNSATDDLRRHIDVNHLTTELILEKVNVQRQIIDLPTLSDINKDTKLNFGLVTQKGDSQIFSRSTALRDLDALKEYFESSERVRSVKGCIVQLDALNIDPTFPQQLKRASFYEEGLGLLTEDACPLCDTDWEIDSLVLHLKAKINKAKKIKERSENLKNASGELKSSIQRQVGLLKSAEKIAIAVSKTQEATVISDYAASLVLIGEKIKTIEGLLEFENQLRSMQKQVPPTVSDATATVHKTVLNKPDNSAEVTAREFITIAQERLQKYQAAKRTLDQKTKASNTAQTALKVFSESVEETLGGLYSQVESKLADYYCFINHDDEAQFKAKLEHKEAALNLEVDFHNRGLFPPGAYYSEGHQDGMGICLYLALMQQQLQDDFTFVVLDDVVMSVDTQHRREVCRLFDEKFPNTQFILTTHEQAWHRQMHSQGLISKKASVSFRNWTVEHGPLVAASLEVWRDIDEALQNEDVPAAAAKLRRHLEYVAQELAESLRAQVTFQGDGNYDLGGLLQPALSRVPKYLKEAKKVAVSWKDPDTEQTVQILMDEFESKSKAVSLEQWASINPAVHYNSWANFSKEDFLPVVESYKALLSLLRCERCETWLCVSPVRGNVESLRCACMRTNFNLRKK